MKRVKVGVVGAGFAATFHTESYKRVHGVDLEVAAIASRTRPKAEELARRYDIPAVYDSFEDLLKSDVDVIDLCVPVHSHKGMILRAAARGKHVVCEKPLVGFVGEGATGATPRREMYERVREDMAEIKASVQRNGVKLLYAENWIYAPAVQKAARLIRASGGTVMDIRGRESHSGSASPYSKRWSDAGGGSLLRLAIHPLSAAIYLKRMEGEHRDGRPIRVKEAFGKVARMTEIESFRRERDKYVATGWQDVEDWSLSILTFEDGSVAIISATDISLGGIDNGLDVYLSNARIRCNIEPNDSCVAYAPAPTVFGDEFIAEKLETKAGWSFPSLDHNWTSGFYQEAQDFAEAVANDREPVSGIDIAIESVSTVYALYVSAEQGTSFPVSW
jgi:predicted dehydrogenase